MILITNIYTPHYIPHMLQIVWRSLLHRMYVTDCLEIPLTYNLCYRLFGNPSYIPYVTDCLEIPLTYHICYRLFGDPSYILQSRLLSHQRNCYRLFGNPSYIPHSRLLYCLIREIVTDCLEIPLTHHKKDYFIILSEKLLQIVWKSLLHTTYVTASLATPLQYIGCFAILHPITLTAPKDNAHACTNNQCRCSKAYYKQFVRI